MTGVQIFGIKNSQETRAAERFFKERRVAIHFVDLKERPMARGELSRFMEKFGGLNGLLDTAGKAYANAGLAYLRVSEADLLGRIERDPALLKLPLVRGTGAAGKQALAIGRDEAAWKAMAEGAPK